jgi:hypothetical protein
VRVHCAQLCTNDSDSKRHIHCDNNNYNGNNNNNYNNNNYYNS